MTINLVANIVSFAINVLINFFLSPYIVRTLGREAYGFIPLMNNLLSTSQIVTIAINSMGARFITIKYHQKDYEGANKYFTSLFYANGFIGAIILLIAAVFLAFIEKTLDVPKNLVFDVVTSFSILSLAFVLGLVFNVFSTATYVKNRLDMSAKRDIIYQLLRGLIILGLFMLFKPTIIYVAVATMVVTLYTIITNIRYTKILLPQFKLRKKDLSFSALKELISSGVWNSIGRMSYTLMNDLDLLISNLFISASAMGILSISKTIPASINSLVSAVVAVFLPTITIQYAKKDIDTLIKEMMKAISIIGIVISPILAFLIGYGEDFYALWQPTENASQLQLLSVFAIMPLYFTLGMKSVGNVFSVTNKLKWHTIVTFLCGLVNIIIVLILLNTTNLGIIAIAMVSSLCQMVKDLTFIPIYASKCLKVKCWIFYKQIIIEFLLVLLSVLISITFNHYFSADSWSKLILYGIISTCIIFSLNGLILFGKKNTLQMLAKLKGKVFNR